MALFGSRRDAQFVNRIGRELIISVIDTEIEYYKINLADTEINMYDESSEKLYYAPILVPTLIDRLDPTYSSVDVGDNFEQSADFHFIRDWLKDLELVPEVGDILKWDTDFYEVDEIIENDYFFGKKPETSEVGDSHGISVGITAKCHKTRKTKLNLEPTRSGLNRQVGSKKDSEYI